jgi:hypothetical protein
MFNAGFLNDSCTDCDGSSTVNRALWSDDSENQICVVFRVFELLTLLLTPILAKGGLERAARTIDILDIPCM